MDPDGQNLGATDAYLVAPFVALFGTSLAAIRIALASVGALTVLSGYWFGRIAFRRDSAASVAATVIAVFPLLAVSASTRLQPGGPELFLLEALCLCVAALIGWGRAHRLRWWALLGFSAGVAMWSDLIFVCVVVAIGIAMLLRASRVGWSDVNRGAAVAVGAGVVGMLPWLVFNIPNGFFSLHAVPRTSDAFRTGVSSLLREQLPVLMGGSSSCGRAVTPAVATDLAFAVLMLALLWTRRRTLQYLVSGHWTGLSQIDLALLTIPVTFAIVLLLGLDADACAPQNLLPMGLPLALGAASILTERVRWRVIALGVAGIWLVVSGIAAAGQLPGAVPVTASGTPIPGDLGPAISMIEQWHPGAVWAGYSLSRLLSFESHDTLPIAEYGGDVGFLQRQQQVETALDPSWVFVAGDPDIAAFLKACRSRSISFRTDIGDGLILYTNLTGSLEPGDVFSGAEATTS
jgi:4-amino-4-deoxy-L-arabinose transferase-like glycosyltransferase